MKWATQHSPAARTASNPAPAQPFLRLTRACAEAGADRRVEKLLDAALEATGAERAFIVRSAHDRRHPIVAAGRSRRDDGKRNASRSVLSRALAARGDCWIADGSAGVLTEAASSRRLELRCVAAAPIASDDKACAALVLDSRWDPALPPDLLVQLVSAFAGLVALCGPAPSASRSTATLATDAEFVFPDGLTREIARAAPTDLPVLIRGETGSGKEVVARELHRLSRRAGGPFVAINCAAFNESLLEAELFGSRRGAFTGADRDRPGLMRVAGAGTLFLDEIGDMPATMQAKLLRVLQERRLRPVGADEELSFDARLLAATHRDLRASVASGHFRADLFFRLAVMRLSVPSLRDRLDELPALIRTLEPRLLRESGQSRLELRECAWSALRHHAWSGNVRELQSVLARALVRRQGAPIVASDLQLEALAGPRERLPGEPLEREMLRNALEASSGCISEAARRIGWSRQKLYRRIDALKL